MIWNHIRVDMVRCYQVVLHMCVFVQPPCYVFIIYFHICSYDIYVKQCNHNDKFCIADNHMLL